MDDQDEVEWIDTGAFDLMAVVSHQGRSADGGHYVCWALSKKQPEEKKDKTGKVKKEKAEDEWILFDDEKVSERPDNVVDLAGGRLDTHIAYFCLYKKSFSKITKSKDPGHALGSTVEAAPANSDA